MLFFVRKRLVVHPEHWNLKGKQGNNLDAKHSEFVYKHHITRLENIYAHTEPHLTLPPETRIAMSPVAQLYGVNGTKLLFPEAMYYILMVFVSQLFRNQEQSNRQG